MTHFVLSPFSTEQPVRIAKKQFDGLRATMKCLRSYLSIEENFEAVTQTYIEMQALMAQEAIGAAVRDVDWNGLLDVSLRVNVSFSKFLAITRQYLDHGAHLVGQINRSQGTQMDFAALTNVQYDRYLGYRVMCALRNCAQHCMPATQSIRMHGRRVEEEPGRPERQHGIEPLFDLEKLGENERFKRSVFRELQAKSANDEPLRVMTFLREYCNGLASIHLDLRSEMKPLFEGWSKKVRKTLSKYKSYFGDHNAIYIYDKQTKVEEVVMNEVPERIQRFQRSSVRQFMFDFHVRTQ